MKKYLGTIATVLVTGIIAKGVLVKVVRKILTDELVKMEKEEVSITGTGDYIFETRTTAEKTLDDMIETLELYKVVTVADLATLMGVTGTYTDVNYGWTDLSKARISRVRLGFAISLPEPIELAQ